MGPKKVSKKSKAEIEAEKLLKEEEERKAKIAEEKRLVDEAERLRLEELRIEAERRAFRVAELDRLAIEHYEMIDEMKNKENQRIAEQNSVVSLKCNMSNNIDLLI